MSAPLVVVGGEAAERRVRADLERIVARLRAVVPPGAFEALALIGGFGRGEGAVIAGPDGAPRGFNDYDLALLVREPIDEAPVRRAAVELARDLEIDFVDVGVLTPRNLAVAPNTVFWYELRAGHRVLAGDPHAFERLPVRDPAQLPLEEGTRLLTNRGLSLLWARLDLDEAESAGAELSPARLRFVVNSIHKAVLAVGDAALIATGRYDISYRERARRVAVRAPAFLGAAAPAGGAPPAVEFQAAHAAATRFKLAPDLPRVPPPALLAWWAQARGWHEAALRALESERLGVRLAAWAGYPARLARESVAEGVRHLRAYLRERRATPDLRGWARHWLDPDRSFRARLPFLLYGVPALVPGSPGPGRALDAWSRFDAALLQAGLTDFPREPAARQERWRGATRRLLKEWHP